MGIQALEDFTRDVGRRLQQTQDGLRPTLAVGMGVGASSYKTKATLSMAEMQALQTLAGLREDVITDEMRKLAVEALNKLTPYIEIEVRF